MRTRSPTRFALCGRYPQRHRDRDPVSGKLFHERVEPFPGRFASQIRRRPPQDLVLLLEQPYPLPHLTHLDRLRSALTRAHSIINSGALQPLLQRHRVNTEIFRDLLDRHSGFTVARDEYDIATELVRVRLRRNNILPGRPIGPAKSDITYPCSNPTRRSTPRAVQLWHV